MPAIVTPDDNTDKSAMEAADEVLGYCAAQAMVFQQAAMAPLISEAQRRIRRRTNPEMFDSDGHYR